MNKSLTLSLLCISAIMFTACAISKQHDFPKRLFVAWNEDTTKSYLLTLFQNGQFYYDISRKDSVGVSQNIYRGTYKLTDKKIFLFYKGKLPENGMASFLRLEITGNYLIQPFTNSYAKEFLRIPRFPRHFMY